MATFETLIPALPQVVLPVEGKTSVFPVRRIFCVGQNYADHAREMGSDPDRQLPFFFTKPADALVAGGGKLPFPSATENLHFEAELAVALFKSASDINVSEALDKIGAYSGTSKT
jgi:fumarylpyruvate hydrolase